MHPDFESPTLQMLEADGVVHFCRVCTVHGIGMEVAEIHTLLSVDVCRRSGQDRLSLSLSKQASPQIQQAVSAC